MFDLWALIAAIIALLPLMLATAWYDLRVLRIPNALPLAVLAAFLVIGFAGLPLDSFLWRLGFGALALVLGFFLHQTGAVGGGDLKMMAALIPFVGATEAGPVLIIYAVTSLALVVLLLIARALTGGRTTGWAALDNRAGTGRMPYFPMGLIFAITILTHLGLLLSGRIG